jgi:hypothetical protein
MDHLDIFLLVNIQNEIEPHRRKDERRHIQIDPEMLVN